jgi:hypothetical protein
MNIDSESIRRVTDNLWREASLLRGERLAKLRGLSEEQLIEKHDSLVEKATATTGGPHEAPEKIMRLLLVRAQVYTDELSRREAVRQGERMETLTKSLNRLTWWIVGLTVLIAIATVIGVGLTAWALFSGA